MLNPPSRSASSPGAHPSRVRCAMSRPRRSASPPLRARGARPGVDPQPLILAEDRTSGTVRALVMHDSSAAAGDRIRALRRGPAERADGGIPPLDPGAGGAGVDVERNWRAVRARDFLPAHRPAPWISGRLRKRHACSRADFRSRPSPAASAASTRNNSAT